MPAINKVQNGRSYAQPYCVGRSVDHLSGKKRIHFERNKNGFAAGLLLRLVSARQPLTCEENGFLPCPLIKNICLQLTE